MSAHTPGPWRSTFRGMDKGSSWASRIPYAIERELGNAVQPIADLCDQPQAEANARLIAAAPDLLAALQALDDYVCNNLTGEYPTGVDVDSAEFKAARAAIAKATGSQP